MTTVSMDYDKVALEVRRLKTVASELQQMQTNAQNAVADLNVFWEGAAADEFVSANKIWRDEAKSIENEITSIANLIQKVADEIKAAEERVVATIAAETAKAVSAATTIAPVSDAAKAAALGAIGVIKK